jgi:type IV secretion system protein VirB4
MLKVDTITKDWKEAGSFAAQLNLFGFWDEHCFLTKTGDLGAVLKIGGIDYESLDYAGRDYAVKRLEAALRSLDDRTRLYQIFAKHNRPKINHAEYDNPLVRATVDQRAAYLQIKSERLYSIQIFWVVMIDGSYKKAGLLHALAQLPKGPGSSLRELRALFSSSKTRHLLCEQIERDRLRLEQKTNSFTHTMEFVAHNFGVALLPRSASRLSHTGVLFKPITDKLLWIETALFVRHEHTDERLRWFLPTLLSQVNNGLSER